MRASSRWVDWTHLHGARSSTPVSPIFRHPVVPAACRSAAPLPAPAPASSQKFAIHSSSSSLKPDSTGWKYGTAQSLRKILVKAINYHSRY